MVMEATLTHDFLERTIKLVLICEKIRKTMNGAATVAIANCRGEFVLLESPSVDCPKTLPPFVADELG
jgi:hypothetical protein